MKETELMIKNWLFCGTKIGQITDIFKIKDEEDHLITFSLLTGNIVTTDLKDIRSIPLTPEILEKNGFVVNKDREEIWYEIKSGKYGLFGISRFETTTHWIIGFTDGTNLIEHLDIHYVHELQNAMTLCKIEKQIEL